MLFATRSGGIVTRIGKDVRWVRLLLLSAPARPLRFACTGILAGLSQLALLSLFTRHGWNPIVANGTAFLLAAQLNFALS